MIVPKNTFFRYKIFFAIVSLNLIFVTTMALFNFYKDSLRLQRAKKQELIALENKVQDTYHYILTRHSELSQKEQFLELMKDRIFEISDVNYVTISIYDFKGNFLASSRHEKEPLETSVLERLEKTKKRVIEESVQEKKGITQYHSYNYLMAENKAIAIFEVSNLGTSSSLFVHFKLLAKQYFLAIIILFILSGYAAWFISKSLTQKIDTISKKLSKTNVEYLDTPIDYSDEDEIKPLVDSYNTMLGKLQEQTHQLAKTEREEAWREMARQVAHEINNPLTPLKLSVQNFQRKYKADDPDNDEKIKNLTQVVVHQIDIIYSIAKSFSDFAKMPISNDTLIDVVKTVKYSVDIFPEHIIEFYSNVDELYYKIDGIYLTRIITNIVKNGIQSIQHNDKKVRVEIKNKPDKFTISIEDNGSGIPEEHLDRVFEHKFTTKSSGMGLGLSMVKKIVEDYHGKIWFETEVDVGTTFYIEFIK